MMNAKKLVWRCRRGVRELDVLFGRFLETEYPQLSESQKMAFERMLEVQDPIIMDWLFSKSQSQDPEFEMLVQRLQLISGLRSD
ncbi:MAG: antitoxin CptB [Arenicella sp.]|jgi:antitoxin CptB